ncbi:MAG: beta-ketoacyl synthase N-terminal-like domain-containing protein, partial [Candidatus Angelobacter sp.]
AGDQNVEDLWEGQAKRGQDGLSIFRSDADLQHTVDKWIAGTKFSKLLELWVKGLEVEWSKLYRDARPQRMSLPTYPFARERYWIDIPGSEEVEVKVLAIEKPVSVQPAASDVLPAVTASLRTLLANELQMQESDIRENVQFIDLGLDSVTGVTWMRKINEKYQTSIEAIRIYSYPTLAQLSRYVKEEAEKQGTLLSQEFPVAATVPVTTQNGGCRPKRMRTGLRRNRGLVSDVAQPIAVIGMAGQFPQAKNLDEFWRNITQGRNCIDQVPHERWDVNAFYHADEAVPGKTYCKWLGALEEYDRFDPLFFSISPKDATSMDPQQRLILQACWHTIESAGYSASALAGVKCGVFMGCTHGDYHLLSREHQLSAQGFIGDATSILAGRISYLLDLQGPCLSIDTACSSSLVAIASACDSLTSGDSDLALAGGVYVMAGPEMHIKTAQAGMLSSKGQCFTFDQRADGFVPGEGVGVVMLKRLAEAQRDKDVICGVIEGWGVNQDGKTNGITAPNLESQTRLEQEVYDKYQIDPAGIQLIEAHGTGTKLGDPIEVQGLKNAFKKYTQNREYCALGSVKSNIGHCLTAAGIAGFIKLIFALQHKQLPPTINFERLNEHIDLEDSPFYVNTSLREWKLNGAARRRAAINSLGFSGTNAHIVAGEYLPSVETERPVSVIAPDRKVVILLSARTREQLKEKARELLEFVR